MRYLITLFYLLATLPAGATLNDVDKTQIYNKNLLMNGGFESGKSRWTASGGTFAVTSSSPMIGLMHATWDSSGASQTLTSTAITIPAGMYGRNAVASCLFTVASGTATHTIEAYDGSNILSSVSITSSTTPTRTSANFIFPSSGSVSLRVYANADEPSVAIDDCYLGPAEGYNVSSVSQATFVGGMENAGSGATCNYAESTSSGATDYIDLGAGTSCAAWTVTSNGPGTISAQGTNDHRLVYTNMPPGNYTFSVYGYFEKSAAAGTCQFRLSDGTNTYTPQAFATGTAILLAVNQMSFNVSVTSAGTRTYNLEVADDHAGTCRWYNSANFQASWKVYRFPSSAEQAYTPDLQAMSWSGYHDTTCSFARASATIGDPTPDASCALTERTNQNFGTVSASGSVLPAITFTPKKAGRYFVCANTNGVENGGVGTATLKLWDGTTTIAINNANTVNTTGYSWVATLCGIYVATDTSSKTLSIQTACTVNSCVIQGNIAGSNAIEWSIFSIDQSLPAPVLTNSVQTSSSGGLRIETVAFGGAVEGTNNCGSTPCTIYRSTPGISSVSRTSTGVYTINFVAGTFSAAPVCYGSAVSWGLSIATVSANGVPTTTTFPITTYDGAAPTIRDVNGYMTCIGAR